MKTLLVAPALHSLHGGIPRILRLYERALVELGGTGDAVEVVILNDGPAELAMVGQTGPSLHGSPTSVQTEASLRHPVRGSRKAGEKVARDVPGAREGQKPAEENASGGRVPPPPTSGRTGPSLRYPTRGSPTSGQTGASLRHLESVGCSRSKLRFAWHLFRLGWRADRIICGHVHLAPLVWLLQVFRPRLRVFIVGHGIEVWRRLSGAQLRAARAAERFICVSEFSRRELLRHNPEISAERVVVVPNAVEPEWGGAPGVPVTSEPVNQLIGSAAPSPVTNHKSPVTILTVSRLTTVDREKGVEQVIAALPRVRAEFPDAELRIVGSGDDEERLRALGRAKQLSIINDQRSMINRGGSTAAADGEKAEVGHAGPSVHGAADEVARDVLGARKGQRSVDGGSKVVDSRGGAADPNASGGHVPPASQTQPTGNPQLGTSPSIVFLGSLDDSQLRAEYAACSVFVLPSRKEGFGLVYLEAMAFGKPCVAADAGAAPEVVTAEVGRLVPYGDVPALAAAIGEVLRRPPDPARIRAHLAKFSYEAFRGKLEKVLARESRE